MWEFVSLFPDPLFCLRSPSSARDKKMKTVGDLLTAGAREKKDKTTSVYRL